MEEKTANAPNDLTGEEKEGWATKTAGGLKDFRLLYRLLPDAASFATTRVSTSTCLVKEFVELQSEEQTGGDWAPTAGRPGRSRR